MLFPNASDKVPPQGHGQYRTAETVGWEFRLNGNKQPETIWALLICDRMEKDHDANSQILHRTKHGAIAAWQKGEYDQLVENVADDPGGWNQAELDSEMVRIAETGDALREHGRCYEGDYYLELNELPIWDKEDVLGEEN